MDRDCGMKLDWVGGQLRGCASNGQYPSVFQTLGYGATVVIALRAMLVSGHPFGAEKIGAAHDSHHGLHSLKIPNEWPDTSIVRSVAQGCETINPVQEGLKDQWMNPIKVPTERFDTSIARSAAQGYESITHIPEGLKDRWMICGSYPTVFQTWEYLVGVVIALRAMLVS
jgi:hypothetical protein